MLNIMSEVVDLLRQAGLRRDEAVIVAQLRAEPDTHLELSRKTGINRTKIYRIVADLEKQGLVSRLSDDRGTFLCAGDISVLEENAAQREMTAARQRRILHEVAKKMPLLQLSDGNDFVVHTYEGVEGVKQMQWHELKTEGTLQAFGLLTYEELVGSKRWAETFRRRVAEAGYTVHELAGRLPEGFKKDFTAVPEYLDNYEVRALDASELPIFAPMVIYNDTVAIYQVERQRKFGVEIVHAGFAKTMRLIFDHYWEMSKPPRK
jgi:DNA-binding MarR family transcriptional regulator